MDGKVILTRGGSSLTLELCDGAVTISGPDDAETITSAGDAKQRFDAELLARLAQGWEIAHVETASSRAEERRHRQQAARESEAEAPERIAAQVCRTHGDVLLVDLERYEGSAQELTVELAARTVRAAGCARAGAIYLHETMGTEFQAHGRTWYASVEPWCAAIGSVGAPACKRLVIDTHYQSMTRQASAYCGDLTQLLNRAPTLERAYIAGYGQLAQLSAPRLQELRFIGEGLSADTVAAVFAAQAPCLETLALGLAYEQVADQAAVEALLDGLDRAALPRLRRLLISAAVVDDHAQLIARLSQGQLLRQLELLFIDACSHCDPEAVVDSLLSQAPALRHLKRLALGASIADDLMDDDVTRLANVLANLELGSVGDEERFSPQSHGWLSYPMDIAG